MQTQRKLALLAGIVLLAAADVASAQKTVVNGAAAPLPADVYRNGSEGILPSYMSYVIVDSAVGKRAFLENDFGLLVAGEGGNVDFAVSEQALSQTELNQYNARFNSSTSAVVHGPLMQLPSMLAPIALPFNQAAADGSILDLTTSVLCGIFSGKITDWSSTGSGRRGPITVVYRLESSGATELLTRHLTSACQPADVAGTSLRLINGYPGFSVQSKLAGAFVDGRVPTNFIASSGAGDRNAYNTVFAQSGRIGYSGPAQIPDLNDATRVAKVKGFSPGEISVPATMNQIAPPGSSADIWNPAKWAPQFTYPQSGYPIVGFTYLLIPQCYRKALVKNGVRAFLEKHYNLGNAGTHDAAIRALGFVPLTPTWREAVAFHFVSSSSQTGLGNANTCAGIGR
ncbi:PstS family phosphate ABC transporter substrate-binding protein [uncultured Stenotrophomonas sp.]|uniref:PstS family phosphate ABC transporter substrate-binding protein n=1 Tax=uncultured Stenotrophomonas sp. TaxID=165438 RepID=UPI0025E66618|nr:substrate-binding domain-containing protein [uncultured Stenotrophomonas sp.]